MIGASNHTVLLLLLELTHSKQPQCMFPPQPTHFGTCRWGAHRCRPWRCSIPQALKVDAGLMTLLAADDGGAPLTLEERFGASSERGGKSPLLLGNFSFPKYLGTK